MADVSRRCVLAAPLLMAATATAAAAPAGSVFDFRLDSLDGGPLSLADFTGKALLVVNTASFCGFTPQYEGLQKLHERYQSRGFAVIGVPSNDFHQESSDASKIREFCETVYGITFPLSSMSHVRGPQAIPLFAWLAARAGGPPRWNFHKYLVARDGVSVRAFATAVEPDSAVLLRGVAAALEGRSLA